jgi:membrane protease YdiL (CAAX protease family)
MTAAWGIGIGIAFIIAQSVAVAVYMIANGFAQGIRPGMVEELIKNGKVVAFSTLASAPVGIGLCVAAAWLRKGITIKEYLALRWPPWRVALKWLGGFVLYLVVVDVALSPLESKATEDFMKGILETVGWAKPFLWIALYIAAPVTEEFYFRGFLFTGFRASWLRAPGAVLVTTGLFALIHLQYDLQGLLFVSAAGFFFAMARLKTESLLLCIALHGTMNFLATMAQTLLSQYGH